MDQTGRKHVQALQDDYLPRLEKYEPVLSTIGGAKKIGFSLGVTDKGYTKDGRTIPDRTDWFNVAFWNRYAEILSERLKKGSRLTVMGKIHIKEYEKDGFKKIFVEVEGESFEIGA